MSTFNNNLLENLPDINFAEKDPEVIMSEIVARFEQGKQAELYFRATL